jgi:hypothetical protein
MIILFCSFYSCHHSDISPTIYVYLPHHRCLICCVNASRRPNIGYCLYLRRDGVVSRFDIWKELTLRKLQPSLWLRCDVETSVSDDNNNMLNDWILLSSSSRTDKKEYVHDDGNRDSLRREKSLWSKLLVPLRWKLSYRSEGPCIQVWNVSFLSFSTKSSLQTWNRQVTIIPLLLQLEISEWDSNFPLNTILFFIILIGVILSPLGTATFTVLLYQPQTIDDGDCGAVCGMKIGRRNRKFSQKFCPCATLPTTNHI